VISVVDATATDRATWRFVRNVVYIGALLVVQRYESDGIAHPRVSGSRYKGQVLSSPLRSEEGDVGYIRDV